MTGGEELCEVCADCTSLGPSLGCHPGSHGRVFDNGITECGGRGEKIGASGLMFDLILFNIFINDPEEG